MQRQEQPEVGMGATICGYTDRQAATVIKVTAKTVTVREDKQKLLNGPNSGEPDALVMYPGGFAAHTTGTQRWSTEPDPDGRARKFSLRKNGRYVECGGSNRLNLGYRSPFYDYNF